ncbi:MAG: hypothetical protein OIF50_16950 [Flavobacteriaceae bacterium]|nr:hypothetical protein [Flavobacteriaceae bacterium]
MKKKQFLIFIGVLFIQFFFYGQCTTKDNYASDLRDSEVLRKITHEEELGQDAWYALYKAEERALCKDKESLENVLSHLKETKKAAEDIADDILQAGGYAKWADNLAEGVDNLAEVIKARQLINKLRLIEPKVTEDLTGLASKNGGEMKGLDYRLKSEESLTRKLKSDGLNAPMNDVLRYTTTFTETSFVKGVQNVLNDLRSEGYEVVKIKNTFEEGVVYKGINTNVKSPDGHIFELQFHTPDSFNVKQNMNHSLYEEYRLLDPKSSRAIELKKIMMNNSDKIVIPSGVKSIK